MLMSQNLQKLEKLYVTGDIDKCIEKTQTSLSKNSKQYDLNYLLALCYFEKFLQVPQKLKLFYLNSCLNNLSIAVNFKKDSDFAKRYNHIILKIQDTTRFYANYFWQNNDKDAAGRYFDFLAKIFADTTDQYLEIFYPEKLLVKNQKLSYSEWTGPTNEVDQYGRKQGLWIERYPNGVVKSEIFYKDGKPIGTYVKYYPNGKVKAKLFFDNQGIRAGAIIYNNLGQKVAMGYYFNQKKDSLWQYFYNDTIVIAEENYYRGVKNGKQISYSYFGPIILEEKNYSNGKLNGQLIRYDIEGNKRLVMNYLNDKAEGQCTVYDAKGNVIVCGNYKNDVKVGIWKYWSPKQNKFIEIEYKDGVASNPQILDSLEQEIFIQAEIEKNKFIEPSEQIKNSLEDFK